MSTDDRILSLRDRCVAMIERLADITRELAAAYEAGGLPARSGELAEAGEDLDWLRAESADAALEASRLIEIDRYEKADQ